MIQFWIEKRNRNWLQITGGLVVISFLFTTISAPFAQSSLWSERKKAVEELTSREIGGARGSRGSSTPQNKSSQPQLELASIAGLSLPALSLPSFRNQLSPEALQQVLTKIQTQPKFSTNKNSLGIPPEFLSHIESYGDIERIYLAKGNHLRFVEGKLKSGAGPLVFLIQDAHGIYSVQKNIALLLKELTAKGAGWVGMEGAEGRIRGLDQYRNYPNKETLNGMAGYLLKEGLLTGVEVAALSASPGSNADYYGVEEKEKYEEQIKSFKDTLESDKVVHGWLLAAETEIKELKEKIYTTELKDLDSKKDKYEQGELKLGEWLDQLVSVRIEGSEKQINLRNYLAAYRLEKTIDFKKVEIDQKKLLEALSSRLSKDELIALLEESIAYRFGKIGYQEFYKGLKHRCEKAGISLTPEMKNYINYISLVEGIDQEKLFEESKELEKKVYAELTRGDEKAEKLYQRDKNYRLLVKAVDFRLSVDEWDEYQKNKEEIAALSPESLKGVLKNVNRFNQLSHERNHIFVEKLMKRQEVFYSRFREAPSSTQTSGTQLFNYSGKESSSSWLSAPISVLVAGGYHSKGIEEILKKKGISFITIRPQMNSEELGRNGNKSERAVRGKVGGGYHPLNAFKRELLPLEKMFLPEKVTLAPRLAMVNTDSVQGRAVQGILNATPVVDTLQGKGGQRAVIKDEKWISKNVFTGVVGSIRVEVSKSKEGADLKSDLEDVGLDTKDFQYGQTNPIGTNEDIIDIATRMEKPSALARAAVLTKPIQQKSQKSASLIFANLRRIKVLISRQLKRAVNAPATIFLTLKEGDSGIPLEGDSQFLTGGESQSEISDASMEGAVSAESSARALKTCRSRIDAIFNVLLTAVNNYIRLKHTETETSADLLTARNRMVWALQTYLDLMREFSLSVKDSRIGILDFVRNYLKVELYLMGGWKRSYQIDPEVYELLADSTPQALRDPALLNGMISKLILQPLTIFMRNKIKEDQMIDRGVIHISVLSGWELQFEYMPIRLDGSSPTVEIRKRYEEIVQAVFAHVDQIVDSKAKAADPKVLKKLVRGQDDFEVEEQESPSAQRPTAKYLNNQIFGIKLSKAVVDQSQEGRWAVLGRRGDHLGEFNTPKGIAVSKPYLWVVDRWNHRIQVYNYKTEQWGSWGTKGDKPGELDGPTGIAFDASGKILVADTENHRIQVCDPKTNQWIVMGKYGSGLGEFKFPSAVAVDKEGRIWVADKMNHRIQSYHPKEGWKSYGKKGRMLGELDGPSDIAVDKDGNVWVADSDNHRIQTFHPSTGEWTSIGRFGGRLGELRNPSGIAFDSKGILWIADNRNDRLQTYSTDTKIWESFGRRGNRPGEFRGPDHIAINHNDIVYVTDVGNHRVQIFSGGRRSFPSRAEASVQIPVQVSALAPSPAAAVSASVPPLDPAVQVSNAESVPRDQEGAVDKSKLGQIRPKESPQELRVRLQQILLGYEHADGVYSHEEVATDKNIRIAEKSEGGFELEYQGRDYSLPQIAKLSEAGFISFYDFLKVLPSMRQGKPPLIFVDSDEAKKSKGLTAALSAFVHITPFSPYVWDFLGVQPPKGRGGIRVTENHVRESLDFLTSDQGIGESRPIVFFFSQWYRDHALWVSQWVKDHPEMGKNIFYVVGGYELDQFFEQNLFNYSVTHDDKQKQKTDIFRAIIKGIMEQGNLKARREDNKSLWNSFAVGSILSLVAVLAVHFGVPHTGNFPEILAFFLAGGFHFRQSVAILIAAIRAGLNKGPTGKRTINKSKIILKFSSLPKAQRKLKSFFTPCKVMHGKIYFNPRLMQFISPEMQELFYQHEKNHIAFELAHPKLSKVPGVEEFFVSVKEFQLAFSREQTRAELFKDLPFLILLFSIGAASLHLNVLLSSILQAVSNTSEEFRRGMVPVIVAAIVVLPRFVRFVNHKVRFERGMLEVKRLIRDKRFLDAHTLPNKFRANARSLKELYRLSKIYSDVGSGLRPEESKMEFSEQSKESFERAIQLAKIYLRKNNPGKESYFIREKLFKFLVDSLISSDMISLVLREVSNEPLQDQFESYAVIGSRRYHLKKDPEVTRMIFKTALRKALTTTEINPYLLILERMYSSGNNSPENKSECFTYFKKLIDQIDIPDDNIIKAACLYDIGDYKGAIVGFAMAEKLAVEILDPMERSRYYDLLAGTMFKFSSPEEVYYTRTSAGKTEVEVVRNSGQYFRSQAGRVASLRSPEYIEKTSSPFYEYMQETVKPKPNSGKKKSLPFGLTAPSLVSFSFLLTGAAKGNPTAFLDFVTGPLLSVFVVAFLALKLFGQILLVMKKEEAVEADKIKFKRNRYSMVAGLVLGLVLIFTNIAKANSYIPLESDPAKKGRILWSFEVHIPEFSKQFINVLEELRRDHKRVYAFNEMAPPNLNWVRFLDPSLASKIERSSNLDDPDLKNELDIFLRNIYWKATSVAGIVKNIQDQVPGIDLNRIAEQDPLLLYLAEHPEIIPINEHAAVETAISQLKADAALENARQQLYDLRNKELFLKEMQKHRDATYQMHLARDRTDAKLLSALIKYNPFSGIGVRRGFYHRDIYKSVDAGDRSQDIFLPALSLSLDRNAELYRQNIKRGLKTISSLTRKDYLLEFPSESVKFYFKPTGANVQFFDKVFGKLSESDLERLTNDIQKQSSLFYADVNKKDISAWMNRLGMFTILWLKENGFISAQEFSQLEFESANSRAYVLSASISDFIQSLRQQRLSYDHNLQDKTVKFFSLASKIAAITGGTALILLGDLAGPQTAHAAGILGIVNPMVGAGMFIGIGILALFFIVQLIGDRGAAKDFQYGQTNPVKEQAGKIVKFMRRNSMRNPTASTFLHYSLKPVLYAELRKGGAISQTTRKMALSHMGGAANSGMLETGISQIQTASALGTRIFLFGMRHSSSYDNLLEKKLAELAIQGKIVLGIEGIPLDNISILRERIRQKYGVEETDFIYGFEDEFVDDFSNLVDYLIQFFEFKKFSISRMLTRLLYRMELFHRRFFGKPLIPEEILFDIQRSVFAPADIIGRLTESAAGDWMLWRFWKQLGAKPLSKRGRQYYNSITEPLLKLENIRKDGGNPRSYEIAIPIPPFKADAWLELTRILALIMAEKAQEFPDDLRPNLDEIKRLVDNPYNPSDLDVDPEKLGANKIFLSLIIDWRNRFIFKRMLQIVDIAIAKNLDTYFTIGRLHISEIAELFMNSPYRDRVRGVYGSTDLIPPEILPEGVFLPEDQPSTGASLPDVTTNLVERKEDNKSLWNSLTIGSILGLSAVAAVHFGVPHTGHIPEMIAFFLVGGFHLTQALMILIAAIRAGLSRGSPYNPEKLIPEFRNLPIEQKNLQSRFTPCQFKNGEILVNPRLMQYIPKGMQRIFYRHEQNHQRHSQFVEKLFFSSQKTIFQQTYLRLSKVPLVEEFIVSLMDFGYFGSLLFNLDVSDFGFLFRENFWKKVALTPVFAVLGMSGVGHGQSASAGARIHFVSDDHHTRANYHERLKTLVQSADVMFIEEANKWNDYYNQISQGSLTPQEFIDLVHGQGESFEFEEGVMALFNAIYGSGKKIVGAQVPEESDQMLAELDLLYDRSQKALISGKSFQAVDAYQSLLRLTGKFAAMKDRILIEQLQQQIKEGPFINYLVVRGHVHSYPYLVLKQNRPDLLITREFFTPTGRMAEAVTLDTMLKEEAAMQAAGVQPFRRFSESELVTAMVSLVLLNIASEEDKARSDVLTLNRIAHRVRSMKKFEGLTQIMRDRPVQNDTDFRVNLIDWIIKFGFAIQEDLMKALGVIQEIQQSPESSGGIASSSTPDREISPQPDDTSNRGSAEVMNRNQGAPSSPLTFLSYIAIHKEFMWKLWEKVEKDFPDLVLIGYDFTIKFKETFDSVVRRNCRMHIDLERPNSYWLDLAAMYVSEYIYKKKLRGPAPWTYGEDVLIEFSLESLVLQMNDEQGIKSVKDYIKEQYGREAAESVGNELISDCLIFFARNIRQAYEQDYHRLWGGSATGRAEEAARAQIGQAQQWFWMLHNLLKMRLEYLRPYLDSQDDFVRQISKATLKEFDREKPEIAMDPLIFQRPIRDESTGVSYSLDLYRQFITEMLRDTLLARFAYKFPDLSRDQLLRIYDAVLSDELEEHSRIMNEDFTQDEVEEDPDIEWLDVPSRPSLTQDQRIYIAMFLRDLAFEYIALHLYNRIIELHHWDGHAMEYAIRNALEELKSEETISIIEKRFNYEAVGYFPILYEKILFPPFVLSYIKRFLKQAATKAIHIHSGGVEEIKPEEFYLWLWFVLHFYWERLLSMQVSELEEAEAATEVTRRFDLEYSNRVSDDARDYVAILAERYGLMSPSEFSYVFKEEDMDWWRDQNYPVDRLRLVFDSLKTIRDLAEKTRYKLVDRSGNMTRTVLSWWSAHILLGKKTADQIEAEFLRLAKRQRGDEKSLWNSLAVGSVLGLSVVLAAHFGVPHTGNLPEILAFFLAGGFHLTQALVILIAAVRAGLNKGPADQSKIILKFSSLPKSQRNLQSQFTPCKVIDGKIHLNPRLMQFIPKGMQRIFYWHEDNHLAFEAAHPEIPKISLLEEFLVSIKDFQYFQFIFNRNYHDALVKVLEFADKMDRDPNARRFADLMAKISADLSYRTQMSGGWGNQPLPHGPGENKLYLELAPGTKFIFHMKTEIREGMSYHLVDTNYFVVTHLKKLAELFGKRNVEIIQKSVLDLDYPVGSVGTIHGNNFANFMNPSADWWKKACGWLEEGGQIIFTSDPKDISREKHTVMIAKLYYELVEKEGWSFDYHIGEARDNDVSKNILDRFVFTKPRQGTRLQTIHTLRDYLNDMIPRVSKASQRVFLRELYISERRSMPLAAVGKVLWLFERHISQAKLAFVKAIENLSGQYQDVIVVLERSPLPLDELQIAMPGFANQIKDVRDLDDPKIRSVLNKYFQDDVSGYTFSYVQDIKEPDVRLIKENFVEIYLYKHPEILAVVEEYPLESAFYYLRGQIFLKKAVHALYIEGNIDKYLKYMEMFVKEEDRSLQLRDEALSKKIQDLMNQNPRSLIVVQRGAKHSGIADLIGEYGDFEKEVRFTVPMEREESFERLSQDYNTFLNSGQALPDSSIRHMMAVLADMCVNSFFINLLENDYISYDSFLELFAQFENVLVDDLVGLASLIHRNRSFFLKNKDSVIKKEAYEMLGNVQLAIFELGWLHNKGYLSQELIAKLPNSVQQGVYEFSSMLANQPQQRVGPSEPEFKSADAKGSLIAGTISFAVGVLGTTLHIWLLNKCGLIPILAIVAVVAPVLHLNGRLSTEHYRWLPFWLEAVLKAVFVVPSFAGFVLMIVQSLEIKKARAKANRTRDGPGAPSRVELQNLKNSLESEFKVVLSDEGKDAAEIAYVNDKDIEELKEGKIHVDLLALYYLPGYLRETILRDHEVGHLKGFNEIQAYLNQVLQSWSNLKRYSKQTKLWRFLTVAGTIFLFLATLFAAPIFKRITNPLASIQGIVSLMESSEVEDDFTKKISQTQISMDGWANNILARTDRNLIIFGEAHSSLFTKRFFRSHILPSLQSAGVKYLVLEHIPRDYQHILDQFNQTGMLPYDFKYLIMLMTRSQRLPEDEILNLLYKARAHEINLIAGGLSIKIGMNINLNTYQGREAMRLGQTGSLIDAVQSIREIERNSKIAVYCGSAHTDKTSNEVANVIEPSLTVDIFDPFNIEPPLDLKVLANEYGVKFRLGHDFLKKMVTTSADRLSLKNKTFAAQTPYQELADWVIYLGETSKILDNSQLNENTKIAKTSLQQFFNQVTKPLTQIGLNLSFEKLFFASLPTFSPLLIGALGDLSLIDLLFWISSIYLAIRVVSVDKSKALIQEKRDDKFELVGLNWDGSMEAYRLNHGSEEIWEQEFDLVIRDLKRDKEITLFKGALGSRVKISKVQFSVDREQIAVIIVPKVYDSHDSSLNQYANTLLIFNKKGELIRYFNGADQDSASYRNVNLDEVSWTEEGNIIIFGYRNKQRERLDVIPDYVFGPNPLSLLWLKELGLNLKFEQSDVDHDSSVAGLLQEPLDQPQSQLQTPQERENKPKKAKKKKTIDTEENLNPAKKSRKKKESTDKENSKQAEESGNESKIQKEAAAIDDNAEDHVREEKVEKGMGEKSSKAPVTLKSIPVKIGDFKTIGKEGTDIGEFIVPEGIAIDLSGRIWVTDTTNSRLQMYDPKSKLWTAHLEDAGLIDPAGISVDSNNHIWFVDYGLEFDDLDDEENNNMTPVNRLYEYDPKTGKLKVILQGLDYKEMGHLKGVAISLRGLAWFITDHKLGFYDIRTETYGFVPNPLKFLHGIAVDQIGKVYISGDSSIYVYDPRYGTGALMDVPTLDKDNKSLPNHLTIDLDGNLWVTESRDENIKIYSPKTRQWSSLGKEGVGAGEFNLPLGIAIHPEGDVWIVDANNHRLQVYNNEGGSHQPSTKASTLNPSSQGAASYKPLEKVAAAAAILQDVRKKGPVKNPKKLKEITRNILYWLGEPIVIAPLWEEELFRHATLQHLPNHLENIAAVDPWGMVLIGFSVFAVSIVLFAFAHMVEKWFVRAYDSKWEKGILPWKYKSESDWEDFKDSLIPALIFTSVYLGSLWGFNSHGTAALFSIFAHSIYNIFVLSGILPSRFKVAVIFGKRPNNVLTPLLYRAFHKTIEAQLTINLKREFRDDPQILELVKNRRALQPFSAIIQLNSVLHMSFLRRARQEQTKVIDGLERVHNKKIGYLFMGTDRAGMYVGSYLYTRLNELIAQASEPKELAFVVQKLLLEISGKDGLEPVLDHISSKFGGRDIEILKDIIGEYLANIAFTLGMTQNEIVLQILPKEGINGVEELLRILRVEFWSLATILDVRLQFLSTYYRDSISQEEANRTIEQFDREKVNKEVKKEKPLDLNTYLSFLNEVVAELTVRFSMEFKGMPQEAMLSSYRYIISKEVEEQRRALSSAQTLDIYQRGSPEERVAVVSGVLETRDFTYLFIGQQLFDSLTELHHLNQFSFLSAAHLLRDEIRSGKIREEIEEEIERHPMLTSTKPGEEENGISLFIEFYLKNFETMIEKDILNLTGSQDEMEFRAMQFYILIWVLSNFFNEKYTFLSNQRSKFGMAPVNSAIEQFCKQAKNVIIRGEDGQSLTEYGIMAGVLAALYVLVSKLTAGVPGMGELILATLLLLGGVGVIVYGAILPVFKEIFGQKDSGKLKEMEKLEERFNRVKGYLNADETVKAEKELKEIEKLKRRYLSEARVVLNGSMKGDGLNPSMSKGTGFGGRRDKRNKKALNLLAMGVALALVTNPTVAESKVVEDHLRSVIKNELSVNLPVEPILSSTVGEHSQELWDEGKVELSDKIEMNQEDINEFEETAWKVAVLAKWASSKVEYKGTSSLSNIGEDLPGATKTFDGTALFSNGVSKEIVEGSILNELRRGGEEKIALTSAYGVSKGKMERAIERLIEKEIDKTLIQSARDRIIYLSSSNGKRVRISSVISQLKSLGLGELGIQIITDDPLRLEESLQFNIRVKIYKLVSATMAMEFKTLRDVAEEMKEFRFIDINA